MLRNNLSLSKLLGIVMFSPAIFGLMVLLTAIVGKDEFLDINEGEAVFYFALYFSIVLLFALAGIGLYKRKFWGRTLAAICLILIIIGFVLMLIFSFSNASFSASDIQVTLNIASGIISVIVAAIGGLLILYNDKLEKELNAKNPNPLMNDILDME